MAPIKRGLIPAEGDGRERRTYEERLRSRIANLAQRTAAGIPHELDKVAIIHFGRLTVIRPEHYLLYSDLKDIKYKHRPGGSRPGTHNGNIPAEIDDYVEGMARGDRTPEVHSFLITQVAFHGDLRTYFRQISEFVGSTFDYIFENCEDYPSGLGFDVFWEWIRRYQIRADLFYTRYPDISVARIMELERFRRNFDAFVAKVRSPTGGGVASIDELFDQFLAENMQIPSGWPTAGGVYEPGS